MYRVPLLNILCKAIPQEEDIENKSKKSKIQPTMVWALNPMQTTSWNMVIKSPTFGGFWINMMAPLECPDLKVLRPLLPLGLARDPNGRIQNSRVVSNTKDMFCFGKSGDWDHWISKNGLHEFQRSTSLWGYYHNVSNNNGHLRRRRFKLSLIKEPRVEVYFGSLSHEVRWAWKFFMVDNCGS